jgi:hypothetical protein
MLATARHAACMSPSTAAGRMRAVMAMVERVGAKR